ncbi:MAG: choice-of-anchor D domain-containing protein, partial [Planctomycetes bacterium]|nr:choice-of-anchor D domain-containing protein [Planctomycetota bacterium]
MNVSRGTDIVLPSHKPRKAHDTGKSRISARRRLILTRRRLADRELLFEPLEARCMLSAGLSADVLPAHWTTGPEPARAQFAQQPSGDAASAKAVRSVVPPAVGVAYGVSPAAGISPRHADYDPTSLIVRMRPDADIHAALATVLPGAEVGGNVQLVPDLYNIDLADGMSVLDAVATLGGLASVLYAEPNSYVYAQEGFYPNDPYFPQLWGLHNTGQSSGTPGADISAPEAWSVTTGEPSVIVAVIDSGVDYNHPDLANNIWLNEDEIPGDGIDNDGNGFIDDVRGWNFYSNTNNPMDDHSHGTHVAGTIGAIGNNGVGVAGVAWNVKIMPLKILGADNRGTVWDAVKALNYAVANGAHVSNNSYAGMAHSSFRDAIIAADEMGHIFVAAAANDGRNIDTNPVYPASYNLPNMITVAGTTNTDGLASWSNYGVNSVHLGAPGVNIYSTLPGVSYGNKSGTSMAAPHVTGTVALLRTLRPDWTVGQLKTSILNTVDQVGALAVTTLSGGRLNAAAAVDVAYPVGPEIYVTLNGRNIADGVSTADFGFTIEGIPVARTFTVTNIGRDPQAGALQLNPAITLPAGFSLVSGFGTTTLPRGESTTFTIRLDAAKPGSFSGTLSFVNNDSDENPFEFTVSGTVEEDTTVRIVDDGDPGFLTSASGWTYRASGGYNADEYWTQNGSGSRTATWQFVVHPGKYRVAATYAAQSYWATNSPFSIRDGSNLLGTVRLDQSAAPDDFTDQGFGWAMLGEFEVTGNSLIVTLSNDALDYVCADAIRIERLAKVQGTNWHDANGNGLREGNESGLASWTIQLERMGRAGE